VAAACCAHLLRRSGISVRIEAPGRAHVPAIMLSDAALALLRDVFDRPDLLADGPRIDRRVVHWGAAQGPIAVPHAAVATSEDRLLAALGLEDERGLPGLSEFSGPPDFVIRAGACSASDQRRFGTREAIAAQVRMKSAGDLSAAWVEALEEGWLFIAPNPAGSSWLLAVGAPPERLLAHSRLIGERIELMQARSGSFDVCPRIAAVPTGPAGPPGPTGERWLAAGTAALAFDPICGDGVAQAVRGAVLAAAVIGAIRDGGDAAQLLRHYDLMLIAALRRHLNLCAHYYEAMGPKPWWQAEAAALAAGHRWCTAQLAGAPQPRFVLRGFSLEPRQAA
jgi:hypothetical protein